MRVDDFDNALATVTQERGEVYGGVLGNFERSARGAEMISACGDPAVRHALTMIWVKICRLIETPDHMDSAIDIAGYARTICMALDERKAREN